MRALVLAALSGAMMLGACASTRMQDSMRELQDSVEAYNEAFRWKNFERAAMYMPADLRAAFLATYEDDENSLHIEDFQIVNVNMENEKSATVTVRLRYMLLPSVSVERASLVQHWKKINEAWTLETEDGSIRELALDKKPKNPEAFGRDPADDAVDPNATHAVEVTDPKGAVLRKEGVMDEESDDD